jgi:hypothetical protein
MSMGVCFKELTKAQAYNIAIFITNIEKSYKAGPCGKFAGKNINQNDPKIV